MVYVSNPAHGSERTELPLDFIHQDMYIFVDNVRIGRLHALALSDHIRFIESYGLILILLTLESSINV